MLFCCGWRMRIMLGEYTVSFNFWLSWHTLSGYWFYFPYQGVSSWFKADIQTRGVLSFLLMVSLTYTFRFFSIALWLEADFYTRGVLCFLLLSTSLTYTFRLLSFLYQGILLWFKANIYTWGVSCFLFSFFSMSLLTYTFRLLSFLYQGIASLLSLLISYVNTPIQKDAFAQYSHCTLEMTREDAPRIVLRAQLTDSFLSFPITSCQKDAFAHYTSRTSTSLFRKSVYANTPSLFGKMPSCQG